MENMMRKNSLIRCCNYFYAYNIVNIHFQLGSADSAQPDIFDEDERGLLDSLAPELARALNQAAGS
jgi:hypothetical protein